MVSLGKPLLKHLGVGFITEEKFRSEERKNAAASGIGTSFN